MMQSAFGVDHGDVSKGLPRALRSGKPRLQRNQSRVAANTYGKDIARMKSVGFRDQRTLDVAQNQRALVRRSDIKRSN